MINFCHYHYFKALIIAIHSEEDLCQSFCWYGQAGKTYEAGRHVFDTNWSFFGGGGLFNIELLANWPFFAGKWWCGVHLPWGQINSLWWPLSLTPSYQRFSHQIKSRIKRQFNHQMGLPDFTTTLIFSHQSICMNWELRGCGTEKDETFNHHSSWRKRWFNLWTILKFN